MCIRDRRYSASENSSFAATPNKTTRPFSISPTVLPSTLTLARVTRCTTARILFLRWLARSDFNSTRQTALVVLKQVNYHLCNICLLYTSDAADERSSVDLGGRRI